MSKIIVGLSGGVDSAVACKLLLEQGFEVEAAFMKNWEEDDTEEACSAEVDLRDAKAVASNLGIKLHTVNFAHEYWERVFVYFLSEYKKGRTPNPDVLCNREIKFKEFFNFAKYLGADKIATGHYANIELINGCYNLYRGMDSSKDQSYFLYLLNQKQLSNSLFPLGKLQKSAVREIAKKEGFDNAKKKDSTGICFIGERNFRDFLGKYLPAQPGLIQTTEGVIIGEHTGLMHYTLGQRKGLHIGGHKSFAQLPWYVLQKDMDRNILVVGQERKHVLLKSTEVTVENPHWISDVPKVGKVCQAQTRYREEVVSATVSAISKKRAILKLAKAKYAVTPGQSLVVYCDNLCLGGGTIHSRQNL